MTKRTDPQLTCVLLVICALAITVGSTAWAAGPMNSPWPMFRHDARHTATSQYGDPVPSGPAWSYFTGGGLSSPVIASDGTIYIGGGSGVLYALNSNGTLKWTCPTGGGATRSTPAIADDGTIYIGGQNGSLYAINPNGTVKWSRATGGEISGSPTIGPDGTIYIGNRSARFYAYTPSGALKWPSPGYITLGNIHMGSACIGPDGTIYIGGGFNLYAINPTGSVKWTYPTGYTIQSSPAMSPDGKTVYVGSCDAYLHAVDTETGTAVWKTTVPLVPASTSSSPAVAPSGMIYIGSNGASASMGGGALFAIDPNGNVVWQYQTAYDVRSSPAVSADGTIYLGVMDGFVLAFNPDGTKKWQFLSSDSSQPGIYGSPAIAADGSVVVQSIGGVVYGNLTCTPPAAVPPSDLTVVATGDTTTSLSWVDNSDDEFGFHIERRIGTIGDFVYIGKTGPNVTTFNDSGLASGQTYYYRVCAFQQAGDSAFTEPASVLMPGLPAPTGLIATPVSGTQIDLTWNDVATDELGYKIERFQGATGPFVQVARVGANVTSYSDMSVNPGVNYYYRVRAYDATRDSSYSNEDWAVTPGYDYSNIIRGNTERNQIALTYDAGTAGIRSRLLDVLRDKQVYCNFYITGYVAQTQPALVARIAAEGHLMSNHSIDHPAFTQITDAEMSRQLNVTDDIIYAITGHKTRPWFRGPYGATNDHVLDVLETEGFRHQFWTVDSGDVSGRSGSAITNTFLTEAANGNVCLSHCTLANSEDAAADTIDGLRALGYELVTVPEIVAPLQVTAPIDVVRPGWNFLSLPIDPANPAPAVVFRGVDITGNLIGFDKETQSEKTFNLANLGAFGQLSSDEGYWLYLPPGQTVKFNGAAATNDRHIKLPQTLANPVGAMTAIGYPFQVAQPVENLKVYNPNAAEPKLRSFAEACSAGWISGILYGWDAPTRSMFTASTEEDWPDRTYLEPWHGYWLTSYVNELELIIPAPQTP